MRFKGLDLNLLVAFDAIMEARSVSGAARQMNLSQPAMSAALSRLRTFFADDLLVSHGKRMHPTAYAESLLPLVRNSLRQVDQLIATSSGFDPLTSKRLFRVIASDYIIAAIIAPLVQRLAIIAPGIRIENILPGHDSIPLIAQGSVDLMITPEEFVSPEQPTEFLMEERHVIAGWRENPVFVGGVTEAELLAAGHVEVRIGSHSSNAFATNQMDQSGRQRNVEVTTASFTAVPWLLIDTMRLALMHERLAIRMATMFPIAIAPIPFPFPAMREMMQFNQARVADDGLSWFRAQIREIAKPL